MTPDDVRREIAEARMRWEREAREVRAARREKANEFHMLVYQHAVGAWFAYMACRAICYVLIAVFAGDPRGYGAGIFADYAPFLLWLAGAATYATWMFGPKSEGDGEPRV